MPLGYQAPPPQLYLALPLHAGSAGVDLHFPTTRGTYMEQQEQNTKTTNKNTIKNETTAVGSGTVEEARDRIKGTAPETPIPQPRDTMENVSGAGESTLSALDTLTLNDEVIVGTSGNGQGEIPIPEPEVQRKPKLSAAPRRRAQKARLVLDDNSGGAATAESRHEGGTTQRTGVEDAIGKGLKKTRPSVSSNTLPLAKRRQRIFPTPVNFKEAVTAERSHRRRSWEHCAGSPRGTPCRASTSAESEAVF